MVVTVLNFLIGSAERLMAVLTRRRHARVEAVEPVRAPASQALATVVILCWKRHANVRRIVDAYGAHRRVGEIIVWNNNAALPFVYSHPKVRCINSDDFGLNTRWTAMLLARHECVIVADDDLMCDDETLTRLIEAHDKDPHRTYALHGRRPTATNQYAINIDRVKAPVECDMHLTRVACTDRRFATCYFELLPEIGIEIDPAAGGGEDIAFSYIVRYVTGKRPMILPGRYANLAHPHAISNRNGSQLANRTEIMRRCQAWFDSTSARPSVAARLAREA